MRQSMRPLNLTHAGETLVNACLTVLAFLATVLFCDFQHAAGNDDDWIQSEQLATFPSLVDSPVTSTRLNPNANAASHSVRQIGLTPEISSGSETWVLVAPYLWATATKGTVGARGQTAPVDVSLSDLVELIPDLNGAFMGHVEVGRGSTGLIFDGLLMQLSPSERGPAGGKITLDVGTTILESLGMVRIVDLQTASPSDSRFVVDLLGGARYYQVQNGIRIDPLVGPTVRADMTKDWVDVVVGARTAMTLTTGLEGFVRGDIGGFGFGTSSTLAWNLTTGVEYACPALPGSSLILGYRVLDIDETQESRANRFVYDVTMHGPFTALAYRF